MPSSLDRIIATRRLYHRRQNSAPPNWEVVSHGPSEEDMGSMNAPAPHPVAGSGCWPFLLPWKASLPQERVQAPFQKAENG